MFHGRIVVKMDRANRILAGIALGCAAWLTWPGAASVMSVVIGTTAFVTDLVGWCPAYALFGLPTKKRAGA